MDRIQAIDTFYNGNYFRSRLEARWAVYFDLINEPYEYEPTGLEFKGKYHYLPDFYLPKRKLYCEIKNRSAMWVDGINLHSGTENANRYKAIAKDFTRAGIMYVIFIGTPYDYLFNEAEWWYDQKTMGPDIAIGDYTYGYDEAMCNTIYDVLNFSFKQQAVLAQKERFENQ